MATLLLVASLCTSIIVCVLVALDRYSILLPFGWVVSILLLLKSAYIHSPIHMPRVRLGTRSLAIVLVIMLPIVIRVLLYQPNRIHGDDLLTAYFSTQYDPLSTNFFSGIPLPHQWVAQFPTPYFLFQKLFLSLIGTTVLTTKLSILPYVFIVSLMTYMIASTLFTPIVGGIAVIIYACMPISIYHETLGLHFISSTAIYMLYFYALLIAIKKCIPFWYVLTGILCAWCYLSYTSSYIAFPILLLVFVLYAFVYKKHDTKSFITWTTISFIIALMPFITFAATHNNYFMGRINQVSLLTGYWSENRINNVSSTTTWNTLYTHTISSLQSFVQSGIGGHGGYTFNTQAFFHPIGLFLFLLGGIISLVYTPIPIGLLFMILTIIISFVTGVILTIPPPAYHRLTLIFPFIALFSAIPARYILSQHPTKRSIAIVCFVLAIYAGTSIHYTQRALRKEAIHKDAAIINMINATYPQRHIHIAAFPSFALASFFPFFPNYTAPSIDSKYHAAYLENFRTDESYVYIITLPLEFRKQFEDADPHGTFIPYSDTYAIMAN